jgi:3'-phosphoadenosine 5'-phosphosulfate sulfotransferase (PAPS reductase)/FAD synthetase
MTKPIIQEAKHIAMLSGGRDSTAMVFAMIENNIPLDYVIFTDTGHEFMEMYEYIDKVESRINEISSIKFIRTKHKRGEKFEDWCFGEVKSGKRKGAIRGLPMVTQPCYWKRESKVYPFEKFLKDNSITEYTQYIGYTYSERKRAQVKDKKQRFPLIEMKMCEADVDKLLERIDLVNPLYDYFERTGCAMCPYQKIRGYYLLWLKFNEKWEWMKSVEHKLMKMEDDGINVINSQWNIRYTLDELEAMFESGEIAHDVEAPKACECEI